MTTDRCNGKYAIKLRNGWRFGVLWPCRRGKAFYAGLAFVVQRP